MSSLALVPIGDMERMAQAFTKSGMFGLRSVDQAMSLMLIAQAEGQHPAAAARDYSMIGNTPAKKAQAMLRDFQAAGGRVEWHAYTDERSDATFTHPQGGSVRVEWDMSRAKKAGLAGKDNYQKYARAMFRSRVISEGVRTIWPAATGGLHTPEETRDFVEQRPRETHMGMAEEVQPAAAAAPAPTAPSGFDSARAAEHEAQYLAMIAEATTPADIERHAATAKADWEPFGEAALPYYKRVRAAASARWRVLKANLATAASMTHGTAEKPATGPAAAAAGASDDWAAEAAQEGAAA